MSDAALVALINGGFGIAVIVLGVLLNRKVNRVREQVENDHPTNMRVEQDERHEENGNKLDKILEQLDAVMGHIVRLWERADSNRERIHAIEQTQPRPPLPGSQKKRR